MPFLSPSTIQAVRGLPVDAVIGSYLTLKKAGANLEACCPFHDEKTPSFTVSPKRGTFKCFGCGAGGDGIAFVQRLQRLDFVPAVEEIAGKHAITLEYDTNLTPEQLADEQLRRQHRKDATAALEFAAAWFASNITETDDAPVPAPFAAFVAERQLSDDTLRSEQVGYAPAGGRALLDAANKAGILGPALEAAGLIRVVKKDARTDVYDVFQERAMFPIRDWRGTVVAFSSRYLGPPPTDGQKRPKYLNSADETWQKGHHLYGLDVAGEAIKQARYALLVEGHVDRLQLVERGLRQTVAAGGTALTDEQIELIKRYTHHVVLCYDHDKAGYEALDRNAARCLAAGLQVSFLVPAPKSKEGDAYDYAVTSDPDEFMRHMVARAGEKLRKSKKNEAELAMTAAQRLATYIETWLKGRADYLTHRAVPEAMLDEALGPVETAEAIGRIGVLLESIPDEKRRVMYHGTVANMWAGFKKVYKLTKRKAVPTKEVSDAALETLKKLTGEQLVDNREFGFFEKNGGYWAFDKNEKEVPICHFTITFLFFVEAGKQSKYVCLLRNFHGRERLAAFSAEELVSSETFNKAISRLHGFIFQGTKAQFDAVKMKRWAGIREAVETRYLGWNGRFGVYAWSNGLMYEGTWYPCDEYGIVTLRHPIREPDEIRALSAETQLDIEGTVPVLNHPAEIFKKLGDEAVERLVKAGEVVALTYHYLPAGGAFHEEGTGDDSARKFRHFGKGNLTFPEWAKLISDVYGADNGRVMVAYYVASLFRSIIYEANSGYFPILYNFGMPQSGKSTAARSLMYMFGTPPQMDGIQLEAGSTTTGLQRFLSSIADGLVWANEYKNTLPLKLIGTLKDLAGGSGKLMGQATAGNETRTTTPRSAAIISGQDLPTADSALFTRCIVLEFDKREHQYDAMAQLEQHQKKGHTTAVTCEVLRHRGLVDAGYKQAEVPCTVDLRKGAKQLLGTEPDSRAILNLASVLTPCKLLMDAGVVKFPFTYDELKAALLNKLTTTVAVQNVSDEVETYLQTLAALPEQQCREGEHYKVQKEADGKVKLYVRTSAVHGAYSTALRMQGGTPMGISSMRMYLGKHKAYLDDVARTRFEHFGNPTSAVVLDYSMIRAKGIEFRMSQAIKGLTVAVGMGAMEEEEEYEGPTSIAHPPVAQQHQSDQQRLRQKLSDMRSSVAEFIGSRPLQNGRARYATNELLADFNWDRVPAVKLDDFRAELKLGDTLTTSYGFRVVHEQADHFIIEEAQPQF